MNTITLKKYKFLFAIGLTLFLGGIFSGSLYAAEKTGLLDAYHAENGIACADCHENEMKREAVSMVKCLECHDVDELAESTADLKPTNPHLNRHYNTGADCNLCHHQHRKSENFCLPCHARFDFMVP